jgi:proline-specific peptidase
VTGLLQRRTFLSAIPAAAAALALTKPQRLLAETGYPPPDRELMVPTAGGRLYVRINGKLDSPGLPLIVIHGGPGASLFTNLPMLALTKASPKPRAVILYDQLDAGQSDWPGNPANWIVPRFVDELESIRQALGIERWHVMGQSWGGTIALEYGARRPPALSGLVLSSPMASARRWIADARVLRSTLPKEVQAQLRKCDAAPRHARPAACEKAVSEFNARFLFRDSQSEADLTAMKASGDRAFNPAVPEAMWGPNQMKPTGPMRDYDGEPLLARLDGARTLFLTGQYDEARPSTVRAYAEQVPGSEFAVVPGAGHVVYSDRPDDALAIVARWLGRLEAR